VGTRVAAGLLLVLAATGCTASRAADRPQGVVTAVATLNVWGSLIAELGGAHVDARSVLANPATDPHDYEATPADARVIADAQLVVENGIGYDGWAARVLAAEPDAHRQVLDVGRLTGVATGGNPHRWYDPQDVDRVADAITADLARIDPADAAYFAARRVELGTVGLARYHAVIAQIRATYAGTPIGASESVVEPLADALGLRVLTPARFLRAISEGSDPSAADLATIDRQIRARQIAVYVVNRQNSTPVVAAQVAAARAHDIPVVAVTETLTPAGTTFADWQVAQLDTLLAALREATGR
jgi:zinc/manganese transport system substrate-binding protein